LEKHKRKPEALRGWCIYWTVMALYTAGTQVSDRFVFWLPMYSEAKVAFVVYLWHPRTQGALYVYDAFVAPFLAKHETAIDRHIDETRVSVGDVGARRARDVVEFAREKFAAALTALPQGAQRGQGGGFGARSATEAAAMAYARGPKQN
jgi:receptor expression-enhancing protein 1/2/3/4